MADTMSTNYGHVDHVAATMTTIGRPDAAQTCSPAMTLACSS